jgi:hypothetical protein
MIRGIKDALVSIAIFPVAGSCFSLGAILLVGVNILPGSGIFKGLLNPAAFAKKGKITGSSGRGMSAWSSKTYSYLRLLQRLFEGIHGTDPEGFSKLYRVAP